MARDAAGYSGTPQARKLGLKPGMRVAIIGAPPGWELSDPPEVIYADEGLADVVLMFFHESRGLGRGFASSRDRIVPAGMIWAAWPRKAAGHVSDLTDTSVRAAGLAAGLVDVKVAAIDEDWSGLKFVRRTADRR